MLNPQSMAGETPIIYNIEIGLALELDCMQVPCHIGRSWELSRPQAPRGATALTGSSSSREPDWEWCADMAQGTAYAGHLSLI